MFIGIQELAANALIELFEREGKKEVTVSQLLEYGKVVVEILRSHNTDAVLIMSKERTDAFIYNCSGYFEMSEDYSTIRLIGDADINELRRRFRRGLTVDMFLALVNEEALAKLSA